MSEPRPGFAEPPEIILDISRLLSRRKSRAPTGVDRVEMAYARGLLALAPGRLSFAAVHPIAGYRRISTARARAVLDSMALTWRGEADEAHPPVFHPRAQNPGPTAWRPRVYLQVSPDHLDQPSRVRAILGRERARFVCLVHDLIPIEYPEYARPSGPARHRRRMATLATLAAAVMTVSDATRRSLEQHLGEHCLAARVRAVPLGVEARSARADVDSADRPYFVAVGTIEPRKNHLLLLNLWRDLVGQFGAATPRLHLFGRRGWENENVVDMLERSSALRGVVVEHGHASDQQMWSMVRGARALLAPSFAEGFGLPVAEALQLGTPVICSDIAAHREVGGGAADYLSPLDGFGWRSAILDYAADSSDRRSSQLERLQSWRTPTWEEHLHTALCFIDEVCG